MPSIEETKQLYHHDRYLGIIQTVSTPYFFEIIYLERGRMGFWVHPLIDRRGVDTFLPSKIIRKRPSDAGGLVPCPTTIVIHVRGVDIEHPGETISEEI